MIQNDPIGGSMTGTAKRVLTQALENNAHLPQHPGEWEHYLTGDDGVGEFMFDHERTGVAIAVECHRGGRVAVRMVRS